MIANSDRPLRVEVIRGNSVESSHAVDWVVVDQQGARIAFRGDYDAPIFPRSAIKAFQALPFVESGACDASGLEEHHLALACASHQGEPFHVRAAQEILATAGCEPHCLECGAQLPHRDADRVALAVAGDEPQAIHNNCSGKHSAFIAFASLQGMPVTGYVEFGHPVQKCVAATLEAVTGSPHTRDNYGIDGCSIPTWILPLDRLAAAMASLGTADSADRGRAVAMARIRDACMAHPDYVCGTDGHDTLLMKALNGRLFCKIGAEGVYAAALPEIGYGIAIKCRDGAERAAAAAMAQTVEWLLELDDAAEATVKHLSRPELRNRRNLKVGEMRVDA